MTVGLLPRHLSKNLLHYHIHQTLRYDDDFDDLMALNEGADLLIVERSRTQLFFGYLWRGQDARTQFPVHLDWNFKFILFC